MAVSNVKQHSNAAPVRCYCPKGVMLHRIDRRGRIVDVSDDWLDVLGYSRDEVIGRKSVDFLTEESRRYAETVTLPDFWEAGHAGDVRYQFVRKDGDAVPVCLSATSVLDDQGRPTSSVAILTVVADGKPRAPERRPPEQGPLPTDGYGLTARELTVLHHVVSGRTDKEIAGALDISRLTVHKHIRNILAKMNASSRTEAGVRALREGLLD